VIVVSSDGFNRTPSWRSIVVVPISTSQTQMQVRRGPTAVLLRSGVAGLRRDGVALCHQVTTLDRAKLVERTGELSRSALAAVEAGLKATLDLD
jgi:mRNA interferase MazF